MSAEAAVSQLMEEYVANANESIHINFTRPTPGKPKPILDEPFNPTFTYPIFGDAETIVGYKKPRIDLNFRANDLQPALRIKFQEEIELDGLLPKDKQQNLNTIFEGILPTSAFDPAEAAQAQVDGPDPNSSSWKPPGSKLCNFALHGKTYEVWSAKFTDPAGKKLWRNMQILVLLFIEGASLLELDEDWDIERWTLYLLYEVTPLKDLSISPYTLAGFSTSYRYWILPTAKIMRAIKSLPSPPANGNGDATAASTPRLTLGPKTLLFPTQTDPLEAPSRERISQFLILPGYQGKCLGTKLYETIFTDLVKQPNIYEITVEDPNEAFDALRDFNDIVYLRKIPTFASLSLASTLPADALRKDVPIPRDQILGNGVDLDALRHQVKIAPRQFNRMLELHLFSTLPVNNRNTARITRKAKSSNANDRKYYFWRLAIKERIYRQNADVLDQLEDAAEKVEKLEMAVDGQQEEYEERLQVIEQRAGWMENDSATQNGESSRGKRKRVIVEDDDEDDEGHDEEMEAASTTSKRARSAFVEEGF
ncbi:histone acetyltransferase type B [Pleomassaria siparia CBS 279.74]|uniref:Histone acetyltransferase type B catalytic subunit n=1 Tax=Pleomassaria siparia CBS 279.74 TaxID=1314801 RepID=A0A6G1KQL3_9PLEO|nr:histone acetyltransferase type B [Pleomassaria siparia CBS 279.74]